MADVGVIPESPQLPPDLATALRPAAQGHDEVPRRLAGLAQGRVEILVRQLGQADGPGQGRKGRIGGDPLQQFVAGRPLLPGPGQDLEQGRQVPVRRAEGNGLELVRDLGVIAGAIGRQGRPGGGGVAHQGIGRKVRVLRQDRREILDQQVGGEAGPGLVEGR